MKFTKIIKAFWPDICLAAGPALTTFAGLMFNQILFNQTLAVWFPAPWDTLATKVRALLLIIGILTTVTGTLFRRQREISKDILKSDLDLMLKDLSQVRNEKEQLVQELDAALEDKDYLIKGYLAVLARNKLGFSSEDSNCERISLYRHDDEGESFVLMGRYASNSRFDSSGKRTHYKDDQGCIAIAWEHDKVFDNGFPQFEENNDAYYEYCRKMKMTKSVVSDIRMKSSMYYGIGIKNATKDANIAVLIIESTKKNRYTKELLDSLITAGELEYLSRIVTRGAATAPLPSKAMKEGF